MTFRSKASAFHEVLTQPMSIADHAEIHAAMVKQQTEWSEQLRIHEALEGKWVFQGRFDNNGNFEKKAKSDREVFIIKLSAATRVFQQAVKNNFQAFDMSEPEICCRIKAHSLGDKPMNYLHPITTGKTIPWHVGSLHVLSASETASVLPPKIKENPEEADLIRRKTLESRGWLDKSMIAGNRNIGEKEHFSVNPDVRIHKNGHGFPDSDFIMQIGKVTLYGHLDPKLNFIKLTYSVANGVEYGVLRRQVKYAGPDRFETLRVSWGGRLGLIISRRHSKHVEGAIINVVHLGSPAFRAGLRIGDRIVAIERPHVGEQFLVHDSFSFKAALSQCEAQEPYNWTVVRGANLLEFKISLAVRYDSDCCGVDEL